MFWTLVILLICGSGWVVVLFVHVIGGARALWLTGRVWIVLRSPFMWAWEKRVSPPLLIRKKKNERKEGDSK